MLALAEQIVPVRKLGHSHFVDEASLPDYCNPLHSQNYKSFATIFFKLALGKFHNAGKDSQRSESNKWILINLYQ